MATGTKVFIFATLLILGVVGYVIFAFGSKDDAASGAPGQSGATAAAASPVVPPKVYTPPAPPVISAPPPLGAVQNDIFAGGPEPPRPPAPKPPPTVVPVPAVPMAVAKRDQMSGRAWTTAAPVVVSKATPIGRLAGWIFNNQGQIIALFEDENGVVRSVGVGDEIAGLRVKAIARDHMVLVDDRTGRETTIKLQGLDTYQRKTGAVDAQPGAGGIAPAFP